MSIFSDIMRQRIRNRMTDRLALIILGLTLCRHASSQQMQLTMNQWTGHIGVITLGTNAMLPIGSGFAFGSHKDIVTCAHVAQHGGDLFFLPQSPPPRKLTLKYLLMKYDLAVFSATPGIEGGPFKVGDFKKIRPGDKIFYMGFDPSKHASLISTAAISATGVELNDGVMLDFLEFVGIGVPGYSGGAVFNDKGELIAVMREAWTKKGLKGGPEVLMNRAISLELIAVLDAEVSTGPGVANTNKTAMTLLDLLEIPKQSSGPER